MENLATELMGLEDKLKPFMADAQGEPSKASHNNIINNYYRGHDDNLTTSGEFLSLERREKDLKNVIISLIKGGFSEKDTAQLIEYLMLSWGDTPSKKWISEGIEKAKSANPKLEKSLAQEVREWVLSSSGVFLSSEVDVYRHLSSREERKNISKILKRLCDEGIIERYGNKNGQFRRIDSELESIDFLNASSDTLNISWPFGIHSYVKIHPGNILCLAGESNAGKTAFALNCALLWQNEYDVHYFSSEMGRTELRERLLKFYYPLESWRVHFWERSSNFADVIRPDAINIIDFLEIHDEFYKVGLYIKEIFDKLTSGIAFILIQKNKNTDFGLGGMRSLEKARLYLSMEPGLLKIVKAKNWASQSNPNGLNINFKLVEGCRFENTSPWEKTA